MFVPFSASSAWNSQEDNKNTLFWIRRLFRPNYDVSAAYIRLYNAK
jgi:hypothetical protein